MDLTKFDRHYFLQFMKLDFLCNTFHGVEACSFNSYEININIH